MEGGSGHARWLADAIAWPFSSADAFESAVYRLNRGHWREQSGPTWGFAQAHLAHQRSRAPEASLDELKLVLERAWFGEQEEFWLCDLLRRWARTFLVGGGSTLTVRDDHHQAEGVLTWRWLSLACPADMVAACMEDSAGGSTPLLRQVDISSQGVRSILERRVAETHLHLGSVLEFPTLWTHAMTECDRLDLSRPSPSDRLKPPPFGSGERLHRVLLCAAIARLVLARHLSRLRALADSPQFQETCDEIPPNKVTVGRTGPREAVTWLLDPQGDPPPLSVLKAVYRRFRGVRPRSSPRTLRDVTERDPVERLCPGDGAPEFWLMAGLLKEVSSARRPDACLERAVVQYLRVRCILYQFLTCQPGSAGLDLFRVQMHRHRPFARGLELVRPEAAMQCSARGTRLVSLEVRARVPRRRNEIWDMISRLRRARDTHFEGSTREVELALVLAFVKEAGAPKSPSPFAQGGLGRFGQWFRNQERQAAVIESALQSRPEILIWFRGLDIAGPELAMPLWPIAPILARVREASVKASATLLRRSGLRVPQLRQTVHVGEDFRTLTEGLRHIDEALGNGGYETFDPGRRQEHAVIRHGDRLGHALSLGHSARAELAVTLLPKEVHLDNLTWELDCARRGVTSISGSRVQLLHREVGRLGSEIYGFSSGDGLCDDLVDARRHRLDGKTIVELGYPRIPRTTPGAERSEAILHRYLFDRSVHERGLEPVEVRSCEEEANFLEAMGRHLRHRASQLELTIEVNPTSNLLISGLGDLDEHPVFRLRPLEAPLSGLLDVSINTDDPVTFATHLANEYELVAAALSKRQVPSAIIHAWLDACRESSLKSRFTLKESRS